MLLSAKSLFTGDDPFLRDHRFASFPNWHPRLSSACPVTSFE